MSAVWLAGTEDSCLRLIHERREQTQASAIVPSEHYSVSESDMEKRTVDMDFPP